MLTCGGGVGDCLCFGQWWLPAAPVLGGGGVHRVNSRAMIFVLIGFRRFFTQGSSGGPT
jgi:hypothetical protein